MANTFSIQAQFDSGQAKTLLAALDPRQWAFATALALTRTAQAVKAEETAAMLEVFDRPTPWTLRSLSLQRATRQSQQARVWFKDPPRLTQRDHYLLPQVYGGTRPEKRFEATLRRAGWLRAGQGLVPTSAAPLDAYGNVTRGLYPKILADLQASPVGANRNKQKRRARFFFATGDGHGNRLPRGIWMRGLSGGVLGGRIRGGVVPIFLETRMPTYRPRFAFFAIAERVTGERIGPEFDKAATETLRTARK